MGDEDLAKYAKTVMDGFDTFYKKRNAELTQKLSKDKTPLEDRVKITRELAMQKTLSSKRLKQSMDNSVKIEKAKIDKVVDKVKSKSSPPISQKKAFADKEKAWRKKNRIIDERDIRDDKIASFKSNLKNEKLTEQHLKKFIEAKKEQKQLKDKIKKGKSSRKK